MNFEQTFTAFVVEIKLVYEQYSKSTLMLPPAVAEIPTKKSI